MEKFTSQDLLKAMRLELGQRIKCGHGTFIVTEEQKSWSTKKVVALRGAIRDLALTVLVDENYEILPSTETPFRDRILNREMLSDEEVSRIICGDMEDEEPINIVEKFLIQKQDWHNLMAVILEINGKFYSLRYYAALTEEQEDNHFSQVAQSVESYQQVVTKWRVKE